MEINFQFMDEKGEPIKGLIQNSIHQVGQ